MSNMSYCRFRNTDDDLYDCLEAMEEGETLSRAEHKAMLRIVEKCKRIVELAECGLLPQNEGADDE